MDVRKVRSTQLTFAVGTRNAMPVSLPLIPGMQRATAFAAPVLAGAVGLIASVLLAAHPFAAIAALTLGACGILGGLPQSWSLSTAFVSGGAAAAGIALINSIGNLAGFVAPWSLGLIKEATGSTAAGVCLLAGSLVVGALLVLSIPAREVAR